MIDAPERYSMSDNEKAHVRGQIDKHWRKTKLFTSDDRSRIEAMQTCYTLAKHRGIESIKDLIDWIHNEEKPEVKKDVRSVSEAMTDGR